MIVMVTGRPLLIECDEALEAKCEERRDLESRGFPPTTWMRYEGTDAQCPEGSFGYWWPVPFDPTGLRAMRLC